MLIDRDIDDASLGSNQSGLASRFEPNLKPSSYSDPPPCCLDFTALCQTYLSLGCLLRSSLLPSSCLHHPKMTARIDKNQG